MIIYWDPSELKLKIEEIDEKSSKLVQSKIFYFIQDRTRLYVSLITSQNCNIFYETVSLIFHIARSNDHLFWSLLCKIQLPKRLQKASIQLCDICRDEMNNSPSGRIYKVTWKDSRR